MKVKHNPFTGLIPACAGKTTRPSRERKRRKAHPRVCGENKAIAAERAIAGGSSPRVRGKLPFGGGPKSRTGLIPACAGKTLIVSVLSSARQAHPRVCGENAPGRIDRRLGDGSSPRVRGKRGVVGDFAGFRGLIPACAGKTIERARHRCAGRAHPRVCGENAFATGNIFTATGSSPRVRGKPRTNSRGQGKFGLIPACAGKTSE